MAFYAGQQFRNTYYAEPGESAPREWPNEYESMDKQTHMQGLLFNPHTATQTPLDPLHSKEERAARIEKASRMYADDPKVRKNLTNVFASTSIPTPVFEEHKVFIEADNPEDTSMPKALAGGYLTNPYTGAGRIVMRAGGFEPSFAAAHEYGHAIDHSVSGLSMRNVDTTTKRTKKFNLVISPISEGIADGFAEKHGVNYFETANLDPKKSEDLGKLENEYLPEQTADPAMEHLDRPARFTGYGPFASSWSTRQDQALYIATRIHVSMHGVEGIKSIPDINKHWHEAHQHVPYLKNKDLSTKGTSKRMARQGFLGELIHKNPSVAVGLSQVGFKDIAEHAVNYHQYVGAQKELNNPQLALPGFKTDAEVRAKANRLPKNLTTAQLKRSFGDWLNVPRKPKN